MHLSLIVYKKMTMCHFIFDTSSFIMYFMTVVKDGCQGDDYLLNLANSRSAFAF